MLLEHITTEGAVGWHGARVTPMYTKATFSERAQVLSYLDAQWQLGSPDLVTFLTVAQAITLISDFIMTTKRLGEHDRAGGGVTQNAPNT